MKRTLLAAVVGLIVLGLVAPAGAQSTGFSIEIEGVARGEEGEVIRVIDQQVDANLVGASCTVEGSTENNASVHPDNDLIITTGDTTAEVTDIEGVPGRVIPGTGSVVLGDRITVDLRFGPNGVTSAGLTLDFTCTPPAPTPGPETGAGGTAGAAGGTTPWTAVGVVGVAALGGAALLGWKRFGES